MYEIKLDDSTFPLAASDIIIDKSAKIMTMELLSSDVLHIPQSVGMAEIKFQLLLLQKEYSFAVLRQGGIQRR